MKKGREIFNIKFIIIILVLLQTFQFFCILLKAIERYDFSKYKHKKRIILKPFCDCSNKLQDYIVIDKYLFNSKKFSSNYNHWSVNLISNNFKKTSHQYNLSIDELREYKVTCDLYNVLKRGKNQRVISYSLYGSNPKYTRNIGVIAKQIKEKYQNYSIRIYYDNSFPKRFLCKLECLYGDVIDFCNVDNFSTNLNFEEHLEKNISYMHKMMWRFLPIGDSFVDIFMSRDTDSFFIDREFDSVNFWINSTKFGHIMRG